jgi:hypothetical protein
MLHARLLMAHACQSGDLAEAERAVAATAGCVVNAVNVLDELDGATPLLLAASNGHAPMCLLLIAAGARMDAPDHHGFLNK